MNEKGLALGLHKNTQLSLQPMGLFLPVDPLRDAERQRPGQLQGAQLGDQAQKTGLVVLITSLPTKRRSLPVVRQPANCPSTNVRSGRSALSERCPPGPNAQEAHARRGVTMRLAHAGSRPSISRAPS
jgi:hypothetical protein